MNRLKFGEIMATYLSEQRNLGVKNNVERTDKLYEMLFGWNGIERRKPVEAVTCGECDYHSTCGIWRLIKNYLGKLPYSLVIVDTPQGSENRGIRANDISCRFGKRAGRSEDEQILR